MKVTTAYVALVCAALVACTVLVLHDYVITGLLVLLLVGSVKFTER